MFDEDPRRWRLMAEIFTTFGLSLEIATAFNPDEQTLLTVVASMVLGSPEAMTACLAGA